MEKDSAPLNVGFHTAVKMAENREYWRRLVREAKLSFVGVCYKEEEIGLIVQLFSLYRNVKTVFIQETDLNRLLYCIWPNCSIL